MKSGSTAIAGATALVPRRAICAALVGTILACLVALPRPAQAGAWTQPKGSYFAKLSGSYLSTTEEFNHRGESVDIFEEREIFHNASYREISGTFYLEYGLSDRFTLLGNLVAKSARTEWDRFLVATTDDGSMEPFGLHEWQQVAGFADLTLSTRYQVAMQPVVFSVEAGIKLPLGYDLNPPNGGPPLGTAETDYEAHLLVGKSFAAYPLYVSGSLGYRFRGGPLNDEMLATAETGNTRGRARWKIFVELIRNTSTPPDLAGMAVVTPLPGGGGAVPGIITGDQDITKVSPSLTIQLSKSFALQAELFVNVAGKNAPKGTTYSLALIMSR